MISAIRRRKKLPPPRVRMESYRPVFLFFLTIWYEVVDVNSLTQKSDGMKTIAARRKTLTLFYGYGLI
jgi:hypothetical protein